MAKQIFPPHMVHPPKIVCGALRLHDWDYHYPGRRRCTRCDYRQIKKNGKWVTFE